MPVPQELQSVLILMTKENEIQKVIDYLSNVEDNCELVAFIKDHFELYEGD